VPYGKFLSRYATDRLDVAEWKSALDQSDWAKRNPRRWSVVDAWITLGMRLGGRSYADYLSDYPTVPLGVESVRELATEPLPIENLIGAAVGPHSYPEDRRDETFCATAP